MTIVPLAVVVVHLAVVAQAPLDRAAPPRITGPDTDIDGVIDTFDKCPLDAEDRDGFEDEDGCPERDNDRDAIDDALDRCPNEAETHFGHENKDGCPDPTPRWLVDLGVTLSARAITVPADAVFSPGTARLSANASDHLLRFIADIVAARGENPRAAVECHSDSMGSDVFNLKLTQDRADALRDNVLGVTANTPGRRGLMKAVGHGDGRPVEPNVSADGRKRNRRCEIVLLD